MQTLKYALLFIQYHFKYGLEMLSIEGFFKIVDVVRSGRRER